jgi:hypothetical protein
MMQQSYAAKCTTKANASLKPCNRRRICSMAGRKTASNLCDTPIPEQ